MPAVTINTYANVARGVWYPSTAGPFYHSTSQARYAVGVQRAAGADKKLRVYKSADGITWTVQDDANGPLLSTDRLARQFSCIQRGNVLYIAYPAAADNSITIASFDTDSDTWGSTITGGPVVSDPSNSGATGASTDQGAALQIEQRDNGNFLALYQNAPVLVTDTASGQRTATADPLTNRIDTTVATFATHSRVSFSSSGTLPAGITAGVFYYAVNVIGATFQIALTDGGPAIDITDAGTGILTATGASDRNTVSYAECSAGVWSAAVPVAGGTLADPNYAPAGIVIGDAGRAHFILESIIKIAIGNYTHGIYQRALSAGNVLQALGVITAAGVDPQQEPRVGQPIARDNGGSKEIIVPYVGPVAANGSANVARAMSADAPAWTIENIFTGQNGPWSDSYLNVAAFDDGTTLYTAWIGYDDPSAQYSLVLASNSGSGWSALTVLASTDQTYETATARAMDTGFYGFVFEYFERGSELTLYLEVGAAPTPPTPSDPTPPPPSGDGPPPPPVMNVCPPRASGRRTYRPWKPKPRTC